MRVNLDKGFLEQMLYTYNQHKHNTFIYIKYEINVILYHHKFSYFDFIIAISYNKLFIQRIGPLAKSKNKWKYPSYLFELNCSFFLGLSDKVQDRREVNIALFTASTFIIKGGDSLSTHSLHKIIFKMCKTKNWLSIRIWPWSLLSTLSHM